MTIATGNQLAILVKTLDTLNKLGPIDAPLRVFELQALAGLSGNFRIGAVQRAENEALSMALGAFYFHAKDVKTGVLFIKWSSDIVDFWTGAQKMTLNEALYAEHRSAVERKLAKDSRDYIAALEIV